MVWRDPTPEPTNADTSLATVCIDVVVTHGFGMKIGHAHPEVIGFHIRRDPVVRMRKTANRRPGMSVSRILVFLFVAVVAFLTAAGIADAAEGKIPIFEPTTVTRSGSYVLTNDISAPSGTAIYVQSDDVSIDLNGFTVESTSGEAAVEIDPGRKRIAITNGIITSQGDGIYHYGGFSHTVVTLKGLTIEAGGDNAIYIYGTDSINVSGNTIVGGRIFVGNPSSDSGALRSGRFTGNVVNNPDGVGFNINLANAAIRNNTVRSQRDCLFLNGTDLLVEGNNLRSDGGDSGYGIWLSATRAMIRGNLIHGGDYGMIVRFNQDGNVIAENTFRNSLSGGIWVQSAGNLVEGNLIRTQGVGIYFQEDAATGNVYRGNMLRGNPSGPVSGSGYTNGGDNICDGACPQ